MTDWKEITDPEELFRLKREGWEVEVDTGPYWEAWKAAAWWGYMKYRARPKQPKMKKVKMLCWLIGGRLMWFDKAHISVEDWIRIPAEDKEIEVPDDN